MLDILEGGCALHGANPYKMTVARVRGRENVLQRGPRFFVGKNDDCRTKIAKSGARGGFAVKCEKVPF